MDNGNNKRTRSLISFDWAVKRLLRNKANFKVLEGFLSELLLRDIIIVNIGESQSNKEKADGKTNQADILVEIEPEVREDTDKPNQENILIEVIADAREIVIIELQFDNEDDYFKRMLYGVSKAIIDYMSMGKKYSQVRKVYSINIVYFDLGKGDDYVYHGMTHFTGLHTRAELQLTATQRQLYGKTIPGELLPEYYIIKVRNFDDVAKNTLDEWIYYLKYNKIKDDFTAQGLDRARQILGFDKLSDEEKKRYWRRVEERRIKDSEFSTSFLEGEAKGLEKGLAKGLEKGLAKGLEKGEAKGLAKGLEKVVRNSHRAGYSTDAISTITGLTREEISRILEHE
jgi:predicted transposase YdaD